MRHELSSSLAQEPRLLFHFDPDQQEDAERFVLSRIFVCFRTDLFTDVGAAECM